MCDVRLREDSPVIAVLGEKKGTVTIWSKSRKVLGFSPLSIAAHESEISCMCLSPDGEWLATASVRGSVIRLFSTRTGQLRGGFRRGRTHATIVNLEYLESIL